MQLIDLAANDAPQCDECSQIVPAVVQFAASAKSWETPWLCEACLRQALLMFGTLPPELHAVAQAVCDIDSED